MVLEVVAPRYQGAATSRNTVQVLRLVHIRYKLGNHGNILCCRWLDYSKLGKPMRAEQLKVTFVSFKVPLKEVEFGVIFSI